MLIAAVAVAGLAVAMSVFAGLASVAAERLGRSRLGWALLGLVTGPIALRVLRMAPPAYCGVCLSPVRGWGPDCVGCGGDVFADAVAGWKNRRAGAGSGGATAVAQDLTTAAVPDLAATDAMPARGMTASAVFVSGTVPLVPGRRYWLDITDTHLLITAPLSALPHNRPLAWVHGDVTTVATGSQFIIRGARPPAEEIDLVFRGLKLGVAIRGGRQLLVTPTALVGWRVRTREWLGPPVVATISAVAIVGLAATVLIAGAAASR